MKKFLFLSMVMYGLLIHSQSISIEYNKKIINIDREDFNSEADWILEINDDISLYRPVGKIRDTSWTKEFEVMGERYKAPSTHYINYEVYYMDVNAKEKTTIHHFAGKDYMVKEPLEIMKWEITNETKKIKSYNCRLAISEKNGFPIEAWFTEEIPVSTNPNGLTGLPGLILEYHLARSHLFVEEIDFDKEVNIKQPDWGTSISRAEYNKIVADQYKYPEGTTFIYTKNKDGSVSTRIIEVESGNVKKN
ncbi:GLPGLI family protein [Aquimarina sp. SS2-1]|uniref:GLPGLI family protein n=1 Tax=Aquimarina besae TaxID=3342247 RepID=UPI00367340EE